MDLSIVIPAYNEAAKIGRDVEAASGFLAAEGLEGEVLVVDDASTDGTADAARSAAVAPGVPLRVLSYPEHRGKGCAVRTGVVATRGRAVLFADSGVCVPFENALRGLALLAEGACEIAHGSRRLPGSVIMQAQSRYRRTVSGLFQAVVHAAMGIPRHITDTQCGFKLYRGDVGRELYDLCTTDGYAFDIEILLRALKRGYRVREFRVEWRCDVDSRLHPARDAWPIVWDMVAVRLALLGE